MLFVEISKMEEKWSVPFFGSIETSGSFVPRPQHTFVKCKRDVLHRRRKIYKSGGALFLRNRFCFFTWQNLDSEGAHAPFAPPPWPPPSLWHSAAAVATSFSLLLQVTSLATALLLPPPRRRCHRRKAWTLSLALKARSREPLSQRLFLHSFNFFLVFKGDLHFLFRIQFHAITYICRNFQFEADSTYLSKFSFLLLSGSYSNLQ